MKAETAKRMKRLRYYRMGGRTAEPKVIAGVQRTIAKNQIELASTTDPKDRELIEEDTREARKYLERLLARKRTLERAKAHR